MGGVIDSLNQDLVIKKKKKISAMVDSSQIWFDFFYFYSAFTTIPNVNNQLLNVKAFPSQKPLPAGTNLQRHLQNFPSNGR